MAKPPRDLKSPKGRTAMKKATLDRKAKNGKTCEGPLLDLTGSNGQAVLENGAMQGNDDLAAVHHPGLTQHVGSLPGPP